jgi:hypothetical protein
VIGGAKDLVGVIKRDASGFGQHQTAPATFEKIMSKGGLKRPDLGGHSRLRDIQALGCAGERTLAGNRAKQPEVVKIEGRHVSTRQNGSVDNMNFS